MLNSKQSNNNRRCCGCFSVINGVRLMLTLEVLMFVIASCVTWMDFNDISWQQWEDMNTQFYLQCLCFSIASGIAILFGVFSKNKFCYKVFCIASIVTTLLCIHFGLWMIYQLDEFIDDGFIFNAMPFIVFITIIICLCILRIYGNMNIQRFLHEMNGDNISLQPKTLKKKVGITFIFCGIILLCISGVLIITEQSTRQKMQPIDTYKKDNEDNAASERLLTGESAETDALLTARSDDEVFWRSPRFEGLREDSSSLDSVLGRIGQDSDDYF